MEYRNWFKDQPASTGSSFSLNSVSGVVAAAVLLAVGTGGVITTDLWRQQSSGISRTTFKVPAVDSDPLRNPVENLERVREIFSPAISDLAKALNVSRQAVYKWMNGELQPNTEHVTKLADLALAADLVGESGITISSAILKRKFTDGMNLFEIARSGESIRDATQLLIQIIQRENEQRELMATRYANRKNPTRSVESDFPAANDKIS